VHTINNLNQIALVKAAEDAYVKKLAKWKTGRKPSKPKSVGEVVIKDPARVFYTEVLCGLKRSSVDILLQHLLADPPKRWSMKDVCTHCFVSFVF
jgi:hypothetical protein